MFYRSFYEAIKRLKKPAERWAAIESIIKYALDGEIVEATGAADMALAFAKPQIDANNRRYENGKKGGRPAKENQTETKQKPKETEAEPKVKEKDKVKEKEKDKVKEKEKDKVKESVFINMNTDGPSAVGYAERLKAIREQARRAGGER